MRAGWEERVGEGFTNISATEAVPGRLNYRPVPFAALLQRSALFECFLQGELNYFWRPSFSGLLSAVYFQWSTTEYRMLTRNPCPISQTHEPTPFSIFSAYSSDCAPECWM